MYKGKNKLPKEKLSLMALESYTRNKKIYYVKLTKDNNNEEFLKTKNTSADMKNNRRTEI